MPTNILPPPPSTQNIVSDPKTGKTDSTWWKWLSRLQITLAQSLPLLGSANQILGVNAAGTANEYKTLTDGNGIDITHSPGAITITVNQMELAQVLAFAARHG